MNDVDTWEPGMPKGFEEGAAFIQRACVAFLKHQQEQRRVRSKSTLR